MTNYKFKARIRAKELRHVLEFDQSQWFNT